MAAFVAAFVAAVAGALFAMLVFTGRRNRATLRQAFDARAQAAALLEEVAQHKCEIRDELRRGLEGLRQDRERVTVVLLGRAQGAARGRRARVLELGEVDKEPPDQWLPELPGILASSMLMRRDERTQVVLDTQVPLEAGAVVLCIGGVLETVEAGGRVACFGLSVSPFFLIPFPVPVGARISCGVVRS